MTNRIYLSRFRALNFRSFGKVDIALPAGPGLVVLEGPNGLGKTSWLEALEWVLSGQVNRWRQQDDDHGLQTVAHIARRGTAGTGCSVELNFGERRARWAEGAAPIPATWLCDDPARWSLRPDNLNGFLRGTHILPQSSSLRLLHLDAGERWNQVLRVVSGYSEIDDLSAALQGSKRPLTTELRDREARLAQAQSVSDAWRGRVAAVLDRRSRAEASGSLLAPSSAATTLKPEDAPTLPVVDTDAGARQLTAHLGGILAARRSERAQLEARRTSLALLGEVPARWQAAQNAVALAEVALEARETDEQRLQDRLAVRLAEEQIAAQRIVQADALLHAAQREMEQLVLLVDTVGAIPRARAALVSARNRVPNAVASLAEVVSRRDEVSRLVEVRSAFDVRFEAHHRRVTTHERALSDWRRIQKLLQRRDAVEQAGEQLKAALSNALTVLNAAKSVLAERFAEAAQSRELAESVRLAASEVGGLVAALARHVDEHTVECPLCLAEYPNLGALQKRAEVAKERQGPTVVRVEEQLQQAWAREAAAMGTVQEAADAYSQAERATFDNRAELDALNQGIGALRTRMSGITLGREEEEFAAVRAALEAERAGFADLPGADLEPGPVLKVRLAAAESAVRTADIRRQSAVAAAEDAAARLAQLEARCVDLRQQLDITEDVDAINQVADARGSLGHAEESLRVAQQAQADARAARERAETEATAATAAAVSSRAARDQRHVEWQESVRSWTSQSLSMPPSREHLTGARDALAKQIEVLDGQIAAVVSVFEGVGRWLEHSALDREVAELDKAAGGAGLDAWETESLRLQALIDEQEEARIRAEIVRVDIDKMALSARRKRTSMRSDLQARLGPILAPMLRSLIVDPTIAQAVVGLAEERTKTRLRATVGREGTDLLAFASEGQLSGVNLAVQLSMALAFPWSSWPAVLLDDPAQYSDVVHTTNLVETLRVLALHHGFQVFLATHERDFALYVERKFRNDGLPATRIVFRQPSDPSMGVVPQLAPHPGRGA